MAPGGTTICDDTGYREITAAAVMTAPEIDQQLAPITELLRSAGRSAGHPGFAERLVRALHEGLVALDSLPRTDRFWAGWANDRATITKLGIYASERLNSHPEDHSARWALIALELGRGASDGGLPLLTPAVAADPAAVGDAVIAAEWIWSVIGIDTTGALRQTLSAAGRAAIERLAADRAGDWTGDAARTALQVMDGRSITEVHAARGSR